MGATRILVIRRGGLGDTLLLLPVLHALRREHLGAALHFAGILEFGDVLAQFDAVDRAMSSEDLQLWALSGDSETAELARARLRGYTLVVADDPSVASVATDHLRVLMFDDKPSREDLPLGEQICDQLALGGGRVHSLLATRSPHPQGAIALAPGAGSPGKCWPRERWLELGEKLVAAGHHISVVVGPVEREGDDPARWPWPANTGSLADLEVPGLSLQLLGCRAYVGNDSGTTHLAAALSVPTVAIFGPTEPRVWAPVGEHVRVVGRHTEGPPDVAVAEVLAAVQTICG